MKTPWIERAVEATHGNQSRIGTIILATIHSKELRNRLRRLYGNGGEAPAFASCAQVTSDGFIISSFIDAEGNGHPGAFVGSWTDFRDNVHGLSSHLNLNEDDHAEFLAQMQGWITDDYRANPVPL